MESIAWLLTFRDGGVAAVGERELLHLVPEPEFFDVPQAPRHCAQVLAWQQHVLPVWDMPAWLNRGTGARAARLAAVVGYQFRRGQAPQFGVLALDEPPRRIKVADSQSCAIPREGSGLGEIAISCFRHEDSPVVVLDLPRMFSGAFAARSETRPASP